ncbi:MAG: 3-deoxy-manno-octulosonate cytidylyltransferase [Acidobacteria bacterium]|nr:3-deoxy-manno-octulosonate cytidylyltransferase [Acidobacteriota bacterium]
MRVAAVIPARMQSTRLPGKPLIEIAGVPMIVRVLERARACPALGRIIVATDSEEILRTVERAGGEARMTSPSHRTGSDRVAEVAESLSEEMILNLQGDEPLVPVSTLTALIGFGEAHPDIVMATAAVPLHEEKDILNPNIVKAVFSPDGRALYFSRCPVPYIKAHPLGSGAHMPEGGYRHYKHVGIYLYRRDFLLRFVHLPPTPLEMAESLEQLRVLEHGYPIHVVPVDEDSVSVDTREDLELVESILAGRH